MIIWLNNCLMFDWERPFKLCLINNSHKGKMINLAIEKIRILLHQKEKP